MRISVRLTDSRVRSGPMASNPGDPFGEFIFQGPCGEKLLTIADDGAETGWEHVSVSTRRRVPNWQEMCFVKDLFWEPEDWVVQFHPAHSAYVNNHPHCLHLWRYRRGEFPTPPDILVGVKALGELK